METQPIDTPSFSPFQSGNTISKYVGYLEDYLWTCPDKHITIRFADLPSDDPNMKIQCSYRGCDLRSSPAPTRNPNIFDNSMIADFTTCPRHAYYTYDLGLTPTSAEYAVSTVAADAGTIWHKLMETLYEVPLTRENFSLRHQIAVETMMKYTSEHYPKHPRMESEDDKRSIEHILATFDMYGDHYFDVESSLDPSRDHFNRAALECVRDAQGKPLTEVNFAIELTPDIVYAGRIDMIARHQGKLFILDFKTSAMNSKARAIREELSHQFYGYILGAQTVVSQFLKEEIQGVIVDSITWNKIIKPERDFRRNFIQHSQDALADWFDQVIWKINNIKQFRKTRMFPQNTQHCDRFMRACEFAMMCKTNKPAIIKGFIESSHKQRFWSPVKGMVVEKSEKGEGETQAADETTATGANGED